MKYFSNNQRGVSLIEIILVVAIMVILAAITLPIQNSVLSGHYLSSATENVQNALASANLHAKIGTQNLSSGVYIGQSVDGKPLVTMYQGDSYENRNKDFDVEVDIPNTVTVTSAPDQDINFHILTGAVVHDIIIQVKNSTGEKTLHVNTAGTVFEEKNAQK